MGPPPDEHETDPSLVPEASGHSTQATRVFGDTELGLADAPGDSGRLLTKAGSRPVSPDASPDAVVGRLGRFIVLETIGLGGMGRVFAAYDDELDRKVAVKLLLDEQLPSPALRTRFQREAQALARLNHPNVVTIHEVGETDDGGLFLAMEFIRGQSLGTWFSTSPPWPQVLEAFVQAGRGLAAAHEAGLVHRDLKPHNIMRSDDGVVKVLDFGLARAATDEIDDTESLSMSISGSRSALQSPLTLTGAVMGTPVYMSPEQHEGSAIDPRSDQYSFCVALWEGLAGSRPLPNRVVSDLYSAKLEGPPDWPASAPAVPRRIIKAVQRGLLPHPADRWPSMEALLDALTTEKPARSSWWWLGLGGLGILTLGAVVSLSTPSSNPEPEDPCAGALDRLVGTWDPDRSAQVESALLGLGKSYAADVWTRTRDQLDAYASDWAAMHIDACEATAVRREQSSHLLDLRMACLDEALVELEAMVDTLTSADATVLENAHELTAGLQPLDPCSDAEALLAEVEPPRAQDAPAVEAIRRDLARARSLRRAGRYEAARSATEDAESTLGDLEYGPVRTELSLVMGSVLRELGEYDAARAAFERALSLAAQWQQHDEKLDASLGLMEVIGVEEQSAEALTYWPLVEGLSHGDPLDEATARFGLAKVVEGQGDTTKAEVEFRAALEIRLEALGPEHPDVSVARSGLAIVLLGQGRSKEAEAQMRTALQYEEPRLGPEHPHIARFREALGGALDAQSRYDEAETEFRAALSIRENALGLEHPEVARTRGNLASFLIHAGKFEEAELESRATLSVLVETLGAEHPRTAFHRVNFAGVMNKAGKYREAEVEARAAQQTLLETLGPEHPSVSLATVVLSGTLLEQERFVDAETELRTILEGLPEALGPEQPSTRAVQFFLAKALFALDRFAEVIEVTEVLHGLRDRVEIPVYQQADVAMLLAKALWSVEGVLQDRERAVELAEGAQEQLRGLGKTGEDDVREIEAWLRRVRAGDDGRVGDAEP